MLVHENSWAEVQNLSERAMSAVMTWLDRNLLTLNVDKSKFITFSIASSTQPHKSAFGIKGHRCFNPSNSCSCPSLQKTDVFKYLGVFIDQLLNWHAQIDNLTARMRKLIYIFKNLRSSANHKTLRLVYSALGESITRYCISVWGGLTKTKMLSS